MPETPALTAIVTRPLDYCDQIEFTNLWGQERQRARVLWHRGETVAVDYRDCHHEIPVTSITAAF